MAENKGEMAENEGEMAVDVLLSSFNWQEQLKYELGCGTFRVLQDTYVRNTFFRQKIRGKFAFLLIFLYLCSRVWELYDSIITSE